MRSDPVVELDSAVLQLIAADRIRVYAYPAVAVKLAEVLRIPSSGVPQVARIVSADPALASAVLRLANSAAYAGKGEVTKLPDAVSRIGLDAVQRIAVAARLGEATCSAGPLQSLRFLVWRWSLSSAFVCQHLARRRRLDPGTAFLAGLLHTFGKPVFLSAVEQVIKDQGLAVSLPAERWIDLVEARYRKLGDAVARQWKLPPLIRAVVLDQSVSGDPNEATILAIAQLADQVVAAMEGSPTVTADTLDLPGFQDASERENVASFLPRLPAAISALLVAPPPPPKRRAGREQPGSPPAVTFATTLKGPLVAVDFPVIDAKAQGRVEYRATHAADNGLVLAGPSPMQTNSVAAVEMGSANPPLKIWVRVTRCDAEGRGHRIEVQPFALGRDDRTRWEALVSPGLR